MEREIRKAIITGATGSIGATLTRLLLKKNIEVTAVIRPGSSKRKNLPENEEGLTIVECDMTDIGSMEAIPCDAWFDFVWSAPAGPGRNDPALQEKNVFCALEAIQKAKECGAKVFIGAGSQAQFGRVEGNLTEEMPLHPENAYGFAKTMAEVETRALSYDLEIDHVWPRILSIYGPYDNAYTMITGAIISLLSGEVPAFTKGEQVWDYLFTEDCAEALYSLAVRGRDKESYVLGSGTGRPLSEYIEILREETDPSGRVNLGGRPYAKNQVMHLVADISKITRDTGWTPKTDFREGIRKTAEYVRKEMEK